VCVCVCVRVCVHWKLGRGGSYLVLVPKGEPPKGAAVTIPSKHAEVPTRRQAMGHCSLASGSSHALRERRVPSATKRAKF
jgi:hypothetical protein